MRLICVFETEVKSKVKHMSGMPPEVTGRTDYRINEMNPFFLTIEENEDGTFLFRLDKNGNVVGDTWHASIDDAKNQAQFEFSKFAERWIVAPDAIDDVRLFGLDILNKTNPTL